MIAVTENTPIIIKPAPKYPVAIICLVIVVLLAEIVFGLCIYKMLTSNFQQGSLREIRSQICEDEIRQILKDPESFYCKNNLRSEQYEKTPNSDIFGFHVWNDNGYKSKSIHHFCKISERFCNEALYARRKRRGVIDPDSENVRSKKDVDPIKLSATDDCIAPTPPSITENIDNQNNVIIARENQNVILHCTAVGNPKPQIEWRRKDKQLIPIGIYHLSSVLGNALTFNQISRVHIGLYECIADNGLPPPSEKTFNLQVYFPPLIRIYKQTIAAAFQETISLECEIEAFPQPQVFWESGGGLQIQDENSNTTTIQINDYTWKTQLNIIITRQKDFNIYSCIAGNEMGLTKGTVIIQEKDGHHKTYAIPTKEETTVTYGILPINLISTSTNQCPPVINPQPNHVDNTRQGIKCDISKFQNLTFLPRNRNFFILSIGNPTIHGFINQPYGSWMINPLDPKRYWITNDDIYTLLTTRENSSFRFDYKSLRSQHLDIPFQGNGHIVYNEFFIYKGRDIPDIIKLNMDTNTIKTLTVPGFIADESKLLYETKYNYFDFSMDDNGLWIIFSDPCSENTNVMKVNFNLMTIEHIWTIDVNHRKFREMFVAYGILYGIRQERYLGILFAYDLFKNVRKAGIVNSFQHFGGLTMATYDYNSKQLVTWDEGNMVTYPVELIEFDDLKLK